MIKKLKIKLKFKKIKKRKKNYQFKEIKQYILKDI